VWVDLAERLGLRLRTPRVDPDADGLIVLRFERLAARTRLAATAAATERYGADSAFARIHKLEDPGFVLDLAEAIARARLGPRPRVLDLGVNTGDELEVVVRAAPTADVVGIDHSASAIAAAQARFPAFRFLAADLGALATLGLGAFDLVISLATLQSPGVDDRAVLRQVVQHHLAPGGAVILGLPNVRYVDGETAYGARMKNFRQPELGLLVKDVAFYRKYLQQHERQVFVTGKHYVLVTGVAARAPAGEEPT
jgi:SAM-dependent methyltransferase